MTPNEDQLADIEPRPVVAAAACPTRPAISVVDHIAVATGQQQPPAPADQQQSAVADWLQQWAEATATMTRLIDTAPTPQLAASYMVHILQRLISEKKVPITVLQPLAGELAELNKKRKNLRLNGVVTSTSYAVAYHQSVVAEEMLQDKKKKKTKHATAAAAAAAAPPAAKDLAASNTARNAPVRRGGRKAARCI